MTSIETTAAHIEKGDAFISWKGVDMRSAIVKKKILSHRGNVIIGYGSGNGKMTMKASDRVVIERATA